MSTSQRDRAIELAHRHGTLTAREAARLGIHSQVLTRLAREGVLERVARGLYRLPEVPVSEHHALALAAAAVPGGVVCLLSALAFHTIGTQVPSRVWIAVDRRARRPKVGWPPLRVVRFGGEALTAGVDVHEVEGVPVRVYSPAKTVADLFKYRNKLGLDVALEALSEAWRERRVTVADLYKYARVCRVERVMRPYLQAIIS
jgi:predicted transcriptional regulator of viral defense system